MIITVYADDPAHIWVQWWTRSGAVYIPGNELIYIQEVKYIYID